MNSNQIIRLALLEDRADQDFTALASISEKQQAIAEIKAVSNGVISGCLIADNVFEIIDPSLQRCWEVSDGMQVCNEQVLLRITGNMRAILSAERTALNFLQHLSGIASLTRRFVDSVASTGCRIIDTRKTTPGLRHLEKQAVRDGGGENHRMDLASGMLIKENHIIGAGSIQKAIAACRKQSHNNIWVEVECETLEEVRQATKYRPDIIMLDNMSPTLIQVARRMVPRDIILEASGGITLETALSYAKTGVDRLAIGALTHSASALDLSMRICQGR
ncbi:MAG: carboxylating nicotinate-nucleotide diphosphorylase [Mariprofundales bacterium]